MNNMENKKNMYGGNNFIFESMANSVLEDKAKGKDKKSENLDSDTLIASILNTSFSILLNSKMENAKTVRGFQEVKNKMLGSNNFGVFRQYLISLLQSLAGMDLAQRDAYQKNIDFVNELFGKLQPLISDDKVFNTTKVGLITKLVNNFEEDLKKREIQLRKTNPTIYADALKKGLVLKEEKKSGEETDVEEAEFRSTAFNKSKESLDAATAFVGVISRDKYVATLKNNTDLSKYEEIADDLYKKAQDLQLTDRAGIAKVVTPSGTFKAGEYKRQQDNLINEIIRQKKEYERVKNAALKAGSNLDIVSTGTPPDPVCPVGMVYDRTKSMCVSSAPIKDETATTVPKKKKTVVPVPVKSCVFPIKVGGAKCTQVGELQNKILELIPSAKSFLTTKGGADKIYGKSTALVTNIIWGYISNNKNIGTDSDLTQEKYDAIMKLTTNDIDLDLSSITPVRDNLNTHYKNKIEESEIILDTPILSFDTFFDIINESSLEEDDASQARTGGYNPPAPSTKKILKDSCIKKSIESGKIEDCFGTKPVKDDEEEKKKEEDKKPKPWVGLKPPKTGIYAIGFDESLMDTWGKVAIGTAAGVAVLATGGAALAAFAPAALGGAAAVGSAAATTAISGSLLATGAGLTSLGTLAGGTAIALSTPIAVGAGAVGGAAAGAWLSGRATLAVSINSGFISRSAITKIVRGLINTIDGYTSDTDFQAIMSTLCILKATWTCDADETKAISAWSEVKRLYLKKEGTPLPEDIATTNTKLGDVENFPDFASRDFAEGMDTDWDDAYDEAMEAIRRLEANEPKMIENLKDITEDMISGVIEGTYMVNTSSTPKKDLSKVKTIDSSKATETEEKKAKGFNL